MQLRSKRCRHRLEECRACARNRGPHLPRLLRSALARCCILALVPGHGTSLRHREAPDRSSSLGAFRPARQNNKPCSSDEKAAEMRYLGPIRLSRAQACYRECAPLVPAMSSESPACVSAAQDCTALRAEAPWCAWRELLEIAYGRQCQHLDSPDSTLPLTLRTIVFEGGTIAISRRHHHRSSRAPKLRFRVELRS